MTLNIRAVSKRKQEKLVTVLHISTEEKKSEACHTWPGWTPQSMAEGDAVFLHHNCLFRGWPDSARNVAPVHVSRATISMCKKQRGIPGERAKVPQQCDDTGKGLHTSIVKKKQLREKQNRHDFIHRLGVVHSVKKNRVGPRRGCAALHFFGNIVWQGRARG